MKTKQLTLRQGDVALVLVASLPAGCTEVPNDRGRIVLAYGEVTGHAHAIADHVGLTPQGERVAKAVRGVAETMRSEGVATEIADAAISRAKKKARLLLAPSGDRYLEVSETVTLRHEEHTEHTLPPGIYHLPTQVEYTPSELRQVAD